MGEIIAAVREVGAGVLDVIRWPWWLWSEAHEREALMEIRGNTCTPRRPVTSECHSPKHVEAKKVEIHDLSPNPFRPCDTVTDDGTRLRHFEVEEFKSRWKKPFPLKRWLPSGSCKSSSAFMEPQVPLIEPLQYKWYAYEFPSDMPKQLVKKEPRSSVKFHCDDNVLF